MMTHYSSAAPDDHRMHAPWNAPLSSTAALAWG